MRPMIAVIAALAAIQFLGVGPGGQDVLSANAWAQSRPPADPVPAQPAINLTAEQRHVIKENIKDLSIEKAPSQTSVAIGATAPQGVTLHSFPPIVGEKVSQVKSHSFFVNGDQVVIVDPKDNTIVDIID